MAKSKYTFQVSGVIGEHGHHLCILTSNEYPWMNCQVIPTPPDMRDQILSDLNERDEDVVFAAGRTDFCVIQAGGGTPEHPTIEITDENMEEVDHALCECMQAAADFWAENGEKITKR